MIKLETKKQMVKVNNLKMLYLSGMEHLIYFLYICFVKNKMMKTII